MELGNHPSVAVITKIPSPYQVELFDKIESGSAVDLLVIYVGEGEQSRLWARRNLSHRALVLGDSGADRAVAKRAIRAADLTVFGWYKDPFVLQCLWERALCSRPWCFWGERPGVYHRGFAGRVFRRAMLLPLWQTRAPIWGIGNWAVNGYRDEFGSSRCYCSVPYFSDLRRFSKLHTRRVERRAGRGILFSGSLIRRKGIDLLAGAFVSLAAKHPGVTLTILGEGDLRPELEEMLRPVAERVAFLGFIDWEDLPVHYVQADILCVPSRYDGWGLVVPEGMASGLPVIGSDRMGAALELIKAGKNGEIVQADDGAAVLEALEKMISLPMNGFHAMREAALETATHYDVIHGASVFQNAVLESLGAWSAN